MVSRSFYLQPPQLSRRPGPSLGPDSGSGPALARAGPGLGPGWARREGSAAASRGPGPAASRALYLGGAQPRSAGWVGPETLSALLSLQPGGPAADRGDRAAWAPAPLARPPGPLPRAPAGRGPGRLPVFQVAPQHLALRPAEDPGWEPNERGSGAPGRAGTGAAATSTGRRERAVRAAAPARRFRGNAARAPAVKSRAWETRGHWREGPLSIPLRCCSQASPAAGSEEEKQPTRNRKGGRESKGEPGPLSASGCELMLCLSPCFSA